MMRLRLATTRDLHRLTEITTTSLTDDPTYDYMWPRRKVYPEDNFFWMQLKLEKHLYDKKSTVLVVEIDGHEESKGAKKYSGPASIIISYGVWERFGCNKAARQRFTAKNTWLNALNGTTARVARWLIDRRYQRRDEDPSRLDALAVATDEIKAKYFSDASDWWSMELLVTDRRFRSRGAATKIVQWGICEADKELLFCGVEASIMGAPLYAANGFKKLDTWVVQVPGDEESLSYDIMRRGPFESSKHC